MVSQPNSALARVETYIREALLAIDRGDLTLASAQLGGALGAVEFAANSQTKLIDACKHASQAVAKMPQGRYKGIVACCDEAVKHAEGPGID